jgi:hypothetical protein
MKTSSQFLQDLFEKIIIIAGPNGSGKTTQILQRRLDPWLLCRVVSGHASRTSWIDLEAVKEAMLTTLK